MRKREFHIWNLPNLVRVSFEENIRKEIFNNILQSTKTIKELANLIQNGTDNKISYETIRGYRDGEYFIPLWFLNKVVNLFFDKEYYRKIEKKVIAFRGPRGDLIYNPNFPWKEDKRIIRIVFRLIGDGHGGGEVSEGRVPLYSNSCNELIEQFINDLNFFGKVRIRRYKSRYGKKCNHIEFPKVIGHILKYLYNIDFRGKYARLSNQIYSLPKDIIIEGIKVFGDDEGSMKGTEIHFYSANKELLQDFINLFNIKFPEFKTITDVRLNSIKDDKFKTYYIAILSNDLEKYSKLIGFYHPVKQRKLIHQLNCKNKIKNNRWNYNTKVMILKTLMRCPKTSYQISENVLINHRTVNKHINGYLDKRKYFKGLKELGLVKSFGNSSEGTLWKITHKGKTYNFSLGCLKR
ncbi:hypothetical protein HYX17_01540 [Candidatus Woesearchaeota archaeon]|nr:hypothetical protein [Candidatus Woesearchaeota archaeon]